MEKSRRTFLKNMALATGAMMIPTSGFGSSRIDKWGQILPLRKLGKTGREVTMLGLGGYHVGWTTEKDAQEVIETAIDGGIRFLIPQNHTTMEGAKSVTENIWCQSIVTRCLS